MVCAERHWAPIGAPTSESTLSKMSTSIETYPGQDFSMSQLLYAVRKKLQHVSFSGRFV